MGACASRPKELDYPKAQLPGELPPTNQEPAVEDVKAETAEPAVADVKAEATEKENKNDGGEGQKVEEPLVDLSSPKESNTNKEVSNDTNNPVADLVSAVAAEQTQTAQTNQDNVVAGNETKEAPKEPELEKPNPTGETKEVVKAESLVENDKPSVASA